jgi:charged multivesicular body protein 1
MCLFCSSRPCPTCFLRNNCIAAPILQGLEDQLFTLKFTSKQLAREAKRCEKEQKAEKLKVKKAIEQGNNEGAQIYAQNAIRMKTQYVNFLRLQSKIDAVCSRLSSAVRMNQVTMAMGSIAQSLEKSCKTMNLEQISATMDKFEEQFDNLEVQSTFVENAMATSTSASANPNEVEDLIQQVRVEHNLQLENQLLDQPRPAAAQEEEDLQRRLNDLKNL